MASASAEAVATPTAGRLDLGPDPRPISGPDDGFHCYCGGTPAASALGMPGVPLLGIYGPDYWPALPRVLITLPFERLSLPVGAASLLAGVPAEAVDVCVVLFDHVPEAPSEKFVSSATNEVNLMLHYWRHAAAAEDWGSREIKAAVRCHAPLSSGVGPLYLDLSDGGIPLGAAAPAQRSVVVHGGGGVAVSPNNCQFAMLAPSGSCMALVAVCRADSSATEPLPRPWREAAPLNEALAPASSGGSGRLTGESTPRASVSVILLPRDAAAEAKTTAAVKSCPQNAPGLLQALAGAVSGDGDGGAIATVLLQTAAALAAHGSG